MVEYALVLIMVSVAAVTLVQAFGGSVSTLFNSVNVDV
jgi:Flp pilus assembly pilin Flp